MATPITDEEKRKQISVRGVATLDGVDDIKNSKKNLLKTDTTIEEYIYSR
jgi:hypothetical protein